jgi:methionyl-tRNA synthetase
VAVGGAARGGPGVVVIGVIVAPPVILGPGGAGRPGPRAGGAYTVGMTGKPTFYVTTPIYYVNDKPHIGHCYTTLLADALARFQRLDGRDVFFLTGTDEHAEKVVSSAREHGVTPLEWANQNAAAFQRAFADLGFTHSDFIRTTEPRHTDRVTGYIERLLETGAVALGDYEGWFDESQEEYVTENVAREHDYKSPVTGRPLAKRTEKNYFFNLPDYADRLREHIEANPGFIEPESRRNEVLGRIRGGLQRVPISRAAPEGSASWGISMPGDPGHRVYVWIDALFNYLSVVDNEDLGRYWPAQVHLIAKDILWFHAVIWPCMLMALDRPLPERVYAHSYWIREGRKMSKSLGNFIDTPTIEAYRSSFGDDALRWYLLTQGPMGATDADFAHERFVEVYNSDLANGIGNAASRVTNMISKYFDGAAPDAGGVSEHAGHDWRAIVGRAVAHARVSAGATAIESMCRAGLEVSNAVDGYINATTPFKLAKEEGRREELGVILYHCAEALRAAAVLLTPALPRAMGELLRRLGQAPAVEADSLEALCAWGGLAPGTPIDKGEALFPRADPDAEAPGAPGAS